MKKISVLINNKIKRIKKNIVVEGDKSISHRSLLIASQCIGISKINNLQEMNLRHTVHKQGQSPVSVFYGLFDR